MHTAVKISVGIGAFLVLNHFMQLNKLAANVRVSLSRLSIHKVSLGGLQLAVTTKVNNPTNASVTLRGIVVRLWNTQGSLLAESPANDRTYSIGANRVTEVGPIYLDIPWASLIPMLGINNISSLVQLFTKGGIKTMVQNLKQPIAMSALMQADGMQIETPGTLIKS